MSRDRFLTWDFDGTLARRPGNWTGVVYEVVTAQRPDLPVTPDLIRPHLQTGFPWHTPDVVLAPCAADDWWRQLLPVLTSAVQHATGVDESEAQRLATDVRVHGLDPIDHARNANTSGGKEWVQEFCTQGYDDGYRESARTR